MSVKLTKNKTNINSKTNLQTIPITEKKISNETIYGLESWRKKAQEKMKTKSINNIEKRCNEILIIVNKICSNWYKNGPVFKILPEWKNEVIKSIINKLNEWNGVDIKSCKNRINTWNEYWDRADNWFNRNKGQWLGDLLFYPLFDTKILNHTQLIANQLSNNKKTNIMFKDLIFIEILNKISHEYIKFKQTRSQSLLIDQSLVQSYKLKNLFVVISKMYKCEWKIGNLKKSAKAYRQAWRDCITQIHYKLNIKYQESKLVIKQQNNYFNNKQQQKKIIQSNINNIEHKPIQMQPLQIFTPIRIPIQQTGYIFANNNTILPTNTQPIILNISPIQPQLNNNQTTFYTGISQQSMQNISQIYRYSPY